MSNDLFGSTYAAESFTGSAMLAMVAGMIIFSSVISLITIISYWKIFKKSNKPGWASIIPVYNIIVMIEIAELPLWYIILLFIPIANIYAVFKINIEIAKKFGKSTGFGIGMSLLGVIFIPLLAFSDSNYKDNITNTTNNNSFDATNVINQNNDSIAQETINNINSIPVQNTVSNNTEVIKPIEQVTPEINTFNTALEQQTVVEQNIPQENVFNNTVPVEPVVEQVIPETNVFNTVPAQQPVAEQNIPQENVFNNVVQVEPGAEQVASEVNVSNNTTTLEPVLNAENVTGDSIINNLSQEKKICKNCNSELPEIVSICPNCGTDNE